MCGHAWTYAGDPADIVACLLQPPKAACLGSCAMLRTECRAHIWHASLYTSKTSGSIVTSHELPRLDQIQKCLNDYLETKRLAFPRFFFLHMPQPGSGRSLQRLRIRIAFRGAGGAVRSNDELLMILSQTKEVRVHIQPGCAPSTSTHLAQHLLAFVPKAV